MAEIDKMSIEAQTAALQQVLPDHRVVEWYHNGFAGWILLTTYKGFWGRLKEFLDPTPEATIDPEMKIISRLYDTPTLRNSLPGLKAVIQGLTGHVPHVLDVIPLR